MDTKRIEHMKAAIEAAKKSKEKYQHAIGAVLVKDDKIISTGMSINQNYHAESNCIQSSLIKLNSDSLTGCTLFSTQEPCTMCLGVALYANLDAIVFGAFASDLHASNSYEYDNFNLIERAKGAVRLDGTPIEIVGGILREDCIELTKDHRFWSL